MEGRLRLAMIAGGIEATRVIQLGHRIRATGAGLIQGQIHEHPSNRQSPTPGSSDGRAIIRGIRP